MPLTKKKKKHFNYRDTNRLKIKGLKKDMAY